MFAALLPGRSLGHARRRVQLRPDTSHPPRGSAGRHDGGLGESAYDLLEEISLRITNEVRGLNRVVLVLTSKPPRDDRVGVMRVLSKTLIEVQ